MYSGAAATDKRLMSAMVDHQRVWFKEYGTKWGLAMLGWVGAAVAAGVVARAFQLEVGPFVIAALGGAAGHLIYGVIKNRRLGSRDEFHTLGPILDLNEGERAYFQAVLATMDAKYLPDSERQRLLLDLMKAMDQLENLQNQAASIRDRAGEPTDDLAAKVEEARRKRDEATDPEVRALRDQTLSLLEERLRGGETLQPTLDRMEAHADLLIQQMRSTEEALKRLDLDRSLPQYVPTERLTQASEAALREARFAADAVEELRQSQGT